jgi:hypothetical protein
MLNAKKSHIKIIWSDETEEEIVFESVVKPVSIEKTSLSFNKDAFNKILANYADLVKRELGYL